MPHDQTELLALVQQLQKQLRDTTAIDPAVAKQVHAVVQEIEAALPRANASGAEELPVVDRLRQAALDFEASHPVLSQTVGNIADSLAKIGI